MVRVTNGLGRQRRHKKFINQAKGFRLGRKNLYKQVRLALVKQGQHAYVSRRLKKRDFRKLWITRINAAARANGISYSRLMDGLKKSGMEINRKMLSEIAIHDAEAFTTLCDTAKKACAK